MSVDLLRFDGITIFWVMKLLFCGFVTPSLVSEHFSATLFNTFNYSSSHIVQITYFLEFLHEYCKEKSETCTKPQTSFVVTKNIEIGFWPASLVKIRHKTHYHREFTCKRDITLVDPWRKIGCSLGYRYLSWKFLRQIFFYSSSASFSCK